jgi:hypothetical protein
LLTGSYSVGLAQKINLSKWQLGVQAGVNVYMGDLTPEPLGAYKTMKPALAIFAARVLSPSFMLRGNLLFSSLKADEAKYSKPEWRRQRNFSFTTPVTELSGLLVWNIFKNNDNYLDRRFSPYLFAGAGVSFMRVQRNYSNLNTIVFDDASEVRTGLAQDLTVTPPRSMLVLPMGAGVEYYISPKVSLTAETNFRYSYTDYIDGFSKAANPNKKDYYYTHTLGAIFKFSDSGKGGKGKTGCPTVAL